MSDLEYFECQKLDDIKLFYRMGTKLKVCEFYFILQIPLTLTILTSMADCQSLREALESFRPSPFSSGNLKILYTIN